jgi:hypothetical protein
MTHTDPVPSGHDLVSCYPGPNGPGDRPGYGPSSAPQHLDNATHAVTRTRLTHPGGPCWWVWTISTSPTGRRIWHDPGGPYRTVVLADRLARARARAPAPAQP